MRLEITCGEAPFLASRYDTTTGEVIPIPERIGILDRKLRIVTENAGTQPDEWLKYACIVVFRQRKNPNLFKDICAAA